MSEEWKFACNVYLAKGEWLQLSVLAGENMSVSEYAAKVLREHAQQMRVADWWVCECGIENHPSWADCQFCKYPRGT